MNTEKPKVLGIDLETYSDVDLNKCGLYKYVEGDFHILLLAYAFDDEEVQIIDLACGELIPKEVLDAIDDPEIIKAAWNAQFERTCIGHYLGRTLSPDSWRCSMVHAASLSLPLSLKNAAKVLKTGEQKDRAGENLIKYFSVPCKPTKANGGRTRNLPEHDLEGWRQFKEYCRQDVRTERDIRKRLELFPMPEQEWDYYHMDQRINDRGVEIDTDLVKAAITCDLALSEEMSRRAYELTGLENPNSVSQLKSWLEERGIPVETLGKKNVAAMIAELDKNSCDEEALDMLKLRLQMAKSSVKKYQAAERCVCKDKRARGLFQFNGASKTNRWAGRHLQLQNLPQNHISTLDEARELVKMGEIGMLESIYGNVPDILSQLIRTMLVPKEGCEFIVADFSAIEARVLAWLAGEEWRLEAFRNGEDIYCASASQMFGVPVVKHGVNGELRQKGKVAELACIAEGQLVLTDYGLIPIEKVTTEMKVWDGEEWVKHDGVVFRGEREVITYEGLTATADHLVWVEGKSWPIQFGVAATCGAHLVQTGDGRGAIRLGKNHQFGETMEQGLECLLRSDGMYELRSSSVAIFRKPHERKVKRVSELYAAQTDTALAGEETDGGKAAVRESERPRISELWSKRHKIRLSKCNGGRTLFDSEVWTSGSENGNRQNRYEQGLCAWESQICGSQNELYQSAEKCTEQVRTEVLALCQKCCNPQAVTGADKGRGYQGCGDRGIREEKKLAINRCKARLYDIRNAGRHHRFTVSGHLVHNCGYQGGSGALISMGALQMGLKENELPEIIEQWRNASPHIVQFWWDMEKMATETVKTHEEHIIGKVKFQYYGGTLWMVLPSGRKLAYLKPKLQPNRFGRMSLTFEGTGNAAGAAGWSRQETYSGKLVENCIAEGTKILTDKGLVAIEKVTVHDRVWDGEAWVSHDGSVNQGEKEVVSIGGLLLTAEHKILTEKGWIECGKAEGLNWADVSLPDSFEESGEHKTGENAMAVQMCMRKRDRCSGKRSDQKEISDKVVRLHVKAPDFRASEDTWDERPSGMDRLEFNETEVPESEPCRLPQLWRAWHNCLCRVEGQLRVVLDGYGTELQTGVGFGSHRQRQGIQPGELPVGSEKDQQQKQTEQSCNKHPLWENDGIGIVRDDWNWGNDASISAEPQLTYRITVRPTGRKEPVYDIRNCGPRHRFAIYDPGAGKLRIVSNCTQATARDILAEAMWRLERAGFEIVGHVHDEVIIEAPTGKYTVDEVCRLMAQNPEWCPDCPLAAAGYIAPKYYFKD